MYKNLIKNKKAVIFDLDGTLADTEPLWKKAFINVLISNGGDYSRFENIINITGLSNTAKWQIVVASDGVTSGTSVEDLIKGTHEEFLKLLDKSELATTDGFWDLAFELKANKQMKLGLTTNTEESIALKILEKLKIKETFDYKIFGDNVRNPKPNPEIYLESLKQLGLKSSEVLVFEDAPSGAKAADMAKIDTIVVWNTEFSRKEYPEHVLLFIPSFEGLASNLDQTFEEAFIEFRDILLKREKEKLSQQTQKQPH